MSNEKIIQIRRAEAANKNNPSDFEVILKNPIQLIPNKSQLSIKNVFVDSVSSSTGKIVLDEPANISISCSNYITNHTTSGKNYGDLGVGGSATSQPDGLKYFSCTKSIPTNLNNIMMIGGIILYKNSVSEVEWGSVTKAYQLYIDYKDITNQQTRSQIPIPHFNVKGGDPKYQNKNQFTFDKNSNPNLFPIYFEGTPTTYRTTIKLSLSSEPNSKDNINTESIYHENSDPKVLPVFSNLYSGSDFYTMESVQYASDIDPSLGAGNFGNFILTGTYVNWRTGLSDTFSQPIPKINTGSNITTGIADNTTSSGFSIPVVLGTYNKQNPSDHHIETDLNTQTFNFNITGSDITNLDGSLNLQPAKTS